MANNQASLFLPRSLHEALAALADHGPSGAPLAGATWIARAPIRRETLQPFYVALSKIHALREIEILDHEIRIGACVTHAEIAKHLAALPDCRALAQAAGNAANPAIRQIATIGGNLCAGAFAASDLVPALLCLDAKVDIATPTGDERMPLSTFLELRSKLAPAQIVLRIIVSRALHHCVHVRLPLRKAGDYPVAIVSAALTLDSNGTVGGARIAVGSVETVARRWERLEADLIGRALDPERAAGLAENYRDDFRGRDGVEAPGWYRVHVLPNLVRRAVAAIQISA